MSESPRRRGRPSTFDRQAALALATDLFWRHGFEGTSVAMLTEAMGVTPPTLYAAFGSKEALYRKALEHYLKVARVGHGRVLREAPSARDAVEAYLRYAADHYADPSSPPGCMVANAALQCGQEGATVRDAVADLRTLLFRTFVARVEQGRLRGELPADIDARALARFYGAVLQGMSVQAADGATPAMLGEIVDAAMRAWPAGQTAAALSSAP